MIFFRSECVPLSLSVSSLLTLHPHSISGEVEGVECLGEVREGCGRELYTTLCYEGLWQGTGVR